LIYNVQLQNLYELSYDVFKVIMVLTEIWLENCHLLAAK